METVKTEDIKEEVTDNVSSSTIEVSYGIEYLEQMTIRCVIPVNKVGLEFIKSEKNDEEDATPHYNIHMSTKTDIKDEIEVKEHELSHEQPTPIKTEGHQIVYRNEHMEHTSFDLLGTSDSEHGTYVSYMESIKGEESVEKEDRTSGGSDVDMEKQNVAHQSEDNYSEYETRDVGKCKVKKRDSFARYDKLREKDIERHQSLLAHKTEDKPALQTVIKETHKRNGKCLKCLFTDYSTTCRQSLNGEFYHCFNCKYKTKVEKDFIIHLKMQHNKTAKWYQSHLCDFKTKLKSNLTQHYRCMHQDSAEIFHCELCGYKTKYKSHLLRHHRWKHDSFEIFHCELCGFETKYKNNMLTHHRLKHDDTAEIIHCELCNYKTKIRQNLLKHNRSHHDDSAQILHCELCNFATKYRSSLSVHHRIKHNNSAETFHCLLCSYKTKHRSTFLRHHRLKHDDSAEFFHCKKCDFKSKNKYNLSRHHKQKH